MHPAILSKGGLGPALKTLARRCPVPAHVDVAVERRLPEPVEVAASSLDLSIHDDGIGGGRTQIAGHPRCLRCLGSSHPRVDAEGRYSLAATGTAGWANERAPRRYRLPEPT